MSLLVSPGGSQLAAICNARIAVDDFFGVQTLVAILQVNVHAGKRMMMKRLRGAVGISSRR